MADAPPAGALAAQAQGQGEPGEQEHVDDHEQGGRHGAPGERARAAHAGEQPGKEAGEETGESAA